MVSLSPQVLHRWILRLPDVFAQHLERLNQLDGQAGDGDHGSTILRGVKAAALAVQALSQANASQTLTTAGTALRRSAGGASGPLFSSLFLELGKTASPSGLDLAGLQQGLQNAASAVERLGKTAAGDRTLLDALLPAAQSAQQQTQLSTALAAAVIAAQGGLEATALMVARRGRAQYVNAGQVQSPDAGAASVVLLLQTLQEVALEKAD